MKAEGRHCGMMRGDEGDGQRKKTGKSDIEKDMAALKDPNPSH